MEMGKRYCAGNVFTQKVVEFFLIAANCFGLENTGLQNYLCLLYYSFCDLSSEIKNVDVIKELCMYPAE